jgi:predicted GNAT family N-acyltransferase
MMARSPSPTTDAGFHLRIARWPADATALAQVREQVFVQEQGVPRELEWDGRDAEALHLLAEDTVGRPIGTARLLPGGHIGRMAVLPGWRRRGVGTALLEELLDACRERGEPLPHLNAQSTAVAFYQRLGFIPEGAEFADAGIPHQRMVLRPQMP